MSELAETGNEKINIEEIMQEIRLQIINTRRAGKSPLPVKGERFSPELYEELYQATLLQGEVGVKLLVTQSDIPILGSLIDKLRGKLHELVIFYVNRAVAQQAEINEHLLRAVAVLIQDLEKDWEPGDEKN